MRVFWFTGRSLSDLCSTTQTSLASGLIERGIDLTMINPDKQGAHKSRSWSHVSVSINARPGFRSRALGKEMLNWCKKNDLTRGSVCLLDWRIANYLIHYLEQQNISWILIDRSPPADSGLRPTLGLMQAIMQTRMLPVAHCNTPTALWNCTEAFAANSPAICPLTHKRAPRASATSGIGSTKPDRTAQDSALVWPTTL